MGLDMAGHPTKDRKKPRGTIEPLPCSTSGLLIFWLQPCCRLETTLRSTATSKSFRLISPETVEAWSTTCWDLRLFRDWNQLVDNGAGELINGTAGASMTHHATANILAGTCMLQGPSLFDAKTEMLCSVDRHPNY